MGWFAVPLGSARSAQGTLRNPAATTDPVRDLQQPALMLPTLAALLALAVPAPQCQEHLLTGAAADDLFGWSLADAGDVDGDQYPDLLIGVPQSYVGSGRAELRSGRTGALLNSWTGAQPDEWFGLAVAGVGDADLDGVPDLLIGSPLFDAPGLAGAGRALLISGASGAVIHELHGDEAGGGLGYVVASAGDLDGDGHADFMLGEPGDGSNGGRNGAVHLHSGATGALIRSHFGTPFSNFGLAFGSAGDMDGDGTPDVLLGAPGENDPLFDAGVVYAHSGATGALLWRITGWQEQDRFGSVVAAVGDWDRDGHDDFAATAVGAPLGNAVVRVISGRTGLDLLDLYHPDSGFGNALAGGHDYDGDGVLDLVIGATMADGLQSRSGAVSVFLGPYGTTPFERIAGANTFDAFGADVVVLPDRDGDRRAELAISAPWSDRAASQAGAVSLLTCGRLRLLAPVPGVAGVSNLLATEGLAAGATAHFLSSRFLGATPVPGCAGLLLDLARPALIGSAVADAQGVARVNVFVPSSMSGKLFALQSADLASCRVAAAVLHRFP
jgi:hypothetical protein